MDVPRKTITLDGAFPEWECAEVKAQTPFYPYNNLGDKVGSHCCGDQLTMFDDYNGKVAWDPSDQVRKRHFLSTFYIKMIILPRQARDKHKKSSKKVRLS